MPQIPTYDDHILPQGQVAAQASPQDFGADIGNSLSQLGSSLEEAGHQVQRVENDQGRMWAYNNASKARTDLQQQFTQQVNALDPSDPEFNTKFKTLADSYPQAIDDRTQELMSQAPNRVAAKVLESHMATSRESLLHTAAAQQAQVYATKTLYETQEGMANDQNSLAADPSNDNYDTLVGNRVAAIGSLESIGPEQKLKMQQTVKHGLAQTQVDVLASTNPQLFLSTVGAGGGRTTMRGTLKAQVPGVATPTDVAPTQGQPLAPGEAPMPDGVSADNSPAAQAQRTQNDIAALRNELARPSTSPEQRKILQQELDKSLAASVSTPAGAPAPQVDPMDDSQIAAAAPNIRGWGELSWQERVAAVRKAEAALGGSLAQDRGAMDRDLRDAQVSLLAGKSFDGLDGPRFGLGNLQRLYGSDEGQRRFEQLNYVKQVGGFIGQMSTMPLAQAQQTLAKLEPQGGQGEAAAAPVFHQATEAFQRLVKMRDDDYMQWAQNNGVGNVKPLDTSSPNNFMQSVRDRLPVAIAGRGDYQADAHIFSNAETEQISSMLTASNPAAQMAYLKAIRTGLNGQDAWFQDAVHQLAPKNTTLATAANISMHTGQVQTDAGAQDSDTVGRYILEGAHILQGKDLDEKTSNGRALKLDDKLFSQAFWNSVGPGAFTSPDSTLANSAASDVYQAVKNYYAADTFHRGMDPSQVDPRAVASAVKAVTGGAVDAQNGSRLFVPWGMPPDQFKDELPTRTEDAIRHAGITAHAPSQYKLFNVDEGKYGLMFGNQVLAGKDGKPVLVDFSKFYGTPKD